LKKIAATIEKTTLNIIAGLRILSKRTRGVNMILPRGGLNSDIPSCPRLNSPLLPSPVSGGPFPKHFEILLCRRLILAHFLSHKFGLWSGVSLWDTIENSFKVILYMTTTTSSCQQHCPSTSKGLG